MNGAGTLIATASVKGTKIKVHDSVTGETMNVLRRGTSEVNITQIVFHPTIDLLACSSNTSTIHIFSLISEIKNKKPR